MESNQSFCRLKTNKNTIWTIDTHTWHREYVRFVVGIIPVQHFDKILFVFRLDQLDKDSCHVWRPDAIEDVHGTREWSHRGVMLEKLGKQSQQIRDTSEPP